MIDDFSTSALDFYGAVEAKLAERQVPDITISRIDWKEGGVFSARREYLRVSRGRLTYDIGAAPYGTSYFFSSWCVEQSLLHAILYAFLIITGLPIVLVVMMAKAGMMGFVFFILLLVAGVAYLRNAVTPGAAAFEELILALPGIGPTYRRLFRPVTYYSIDTRLMFQKSVHRAVVESIEALRTARGLRAFSPDEIKPTTRDIA